MKSLDRRLRGIASSEGADFFGYADLAPAREAIRMQGGERIASYPRAVSIGIGIPNELVEQLADRERPGVRVSYRNHGYKVINARLDAVTSKIACEIERAGFRALPVPASERMDSNRICAEFSHKMAANLAGLGWIGRSCLLITPQRGPRVRWGTVLTDAPLEASASRLKSKCGRCTKCVEVCPIHAFTGKAFDEKEPREARFDAKACDQYFNRMDKEGIVPICGMCLFICPHGRKK
ncbi:MAG: 4Fe-4S dicluster domain-containing protein [Methanomassiliicoccales archaeon]|nr:4Fe-4S dicluster domain-containing protein [Methanomassiliicoccales archaeon]